MLAKKKIGPAVVVSWSAVLAPAAGVVAADEPRLVCVPDSPVVLKLGEATDAAGRVTPTYAISLDGNEFSEPQATSYELALHHSRFDPLAGAPVLEDGFAADGGNRLFIVQYLTPPLPAFRDAIHEAGGEALAYIANHGYVVRMSARTALAVDAMPFVRWVGAWHPAFRLERAALDAIVDGEVGADPRPYHLHVTKRGLAEKQVVADRIRALGGAVEPLSPNGHLMNATLSVAQLTAVIRMNEVLYVDRRFPPRTYMDNVRIDGGADSVESVAGYNGHGVRAEVIDSGLLTSHQAWAAPPIIHAPNSANDWHGTQVYGCVFSDGTGNAAGRGIIPAAQGIFSSYSNLGDRYDHTMELVEPPYSAVFQTNSWGSCCTTTYGTQAAYMDLIIFDSDLLILQAQANSGNQSSDVHAWAKNVVSVGGIRHQNTLNRADDAWSFAGSIGPADDGRIKPDLSYWYDAILTTSDSGGYTGGFGGTSAATPMTAGHFGVMFQMWNDGIFGNTVSAGGTVFDNRPHMATAKALMINTAVPYAFSGSGHDLTRTHQGWGVANVANLYDLREKIFVVDESDVLTMLQTTTYRLVVDADEPSLKVTMAYMDPPGNPAASVARINDLDLTVISPSGTVYRGNNGLAEGNVSTPDGPSNTVDTVENVWIASPEAGTWEVEVFARKVFEDGHVETPEVDADYALVVTGVIGLDESCPDVTGDGMVGILDLLAVLAEWEQPGGPADVNGDGAVDILDFLIVLAEWGPCP